MASKARKPRLIFVVRWSSRGMGSSIMRVTQLAAHMRRFHGDDYDVRVAYVSRAHKLWVRAWLAAHPRDSIYFCSKYVASGWPPEAFERLRRKAIAVLVDYVDLAVGRMVPFGVDAHIATSFAGTRALQRKQDAMRTAGQKVGGAIHTVLHNYDVALDTLRFTPPRNCRLRFWVARRKLLSRRGSRQRSPFLTLVSDPHLKGMSAT
ncbi:MAG: hypothetical protein GDA52_01895 [Rhodobacteraceae bacterium]|nr:hypothetical protein [Paracoccaceae bacterium]